MRIRSGGAALVLVAMSVPGSLSAQTMVTLEIPVNLTKLSPQITKVGVSCTFTSDGVVYINAGPRIAQDQLPVVNAQMISTFRVVFELKAEDLKAPIGKTAEYQCSLFASTSNVNAAFSEDDPASPFYLKPTPRTIVGTFVW